MYGVTDCLLFLFPDSFDLFIALSEGIASLPDTFHTACSLAKSIAPHCLTFSFGPKTALMWFYGDSGLALNIYLIAFLTEKFRLWMSSCIHLFSWHATLSEQNTHTYNKEYLGKILKKRWCFLLQNQRLVECFGISQTFIVVPKCKGLYTKLLAS